MPLRQIHAPVFNLCMNEWVPFSNPPKNRLRQKIVAMCWGAHGSQSSEWRGFLLNSAAVVLWKRDWGNPLTDRFTLERTRAVSSVLCAQSAGTHYHCEGRKVNTHIHVHTCKQISYTSRHTTYSQLSRKSKLICKLWNINVLLTHRSFHTEPQSVGLYYTIGMNILGGISLLTVLYLLWQE